MSTILKCAALGATLLALGAAPAHGDGLPVLGIDVGASGITQPGSSVRYVTLDSSDGTVVAAISRHDGTVQRQSWMREQLTVPAVAYDSTPAGLSRDGRWLVLIRPRAAFPQKTTRLVALNAGNLRPHRKLTLRGDFSFDALSPDGRTAFLIHYTSKVDFTRYEVRALNLGSGRLVAGRIVDPHEADESMRGLPLSRTTSPDGRWAYTLYDRQGKAPFIHALDTMGRTARCIDLAALAGRRRCRRTTCPAARLRSSCAGSRVARGRRRDPRRERDRARRARCRVARRGDELGRAAGRFRRARSA